MIKELIILSLLIIATFGLFNLILSHKELSSKYSRVRFFYDNFWQLIGYVVTGLILYLMYKFNILDSKEWLYYEFNQLK